VDDQFFSNHFRPGLQEVNCLELFYNANALPINQQTILKY